jgi:hypothetical protein
MCTIVGVYLLLVMCEKPEVVMLRFPDMECVGYFAPHKKCNAVLVGEVSSDVFYSVGVRE